MEQEYIIEGKIKRKAVRLTCEYCGKSFLRADRIHRHDLKDGCHHNYCCRDCYLKANAAKAYTFTCSYCGKVFKRKGNRVRSSVNKTGLRFCSRACKDAAQRIASGTIFQAMRPTSYGRGTGKYVYRDKALRHYPHKCEVCGWDEDVDVLQVHHIDSNRNNNKLENLIVLCPTCHFKLTTKKYVLDREHGKINKK